MKNIKHLLLSISFLTFTQAVQATVAVHIPTNEPIESLDEKSDGTYKVYMRSSNGEVTKKRIPKSEVSFISSKPVNGFKYGWVLVDHGTDKKLEHCQVSAIFKNGQVHAFCDYILNHELRRHRYRATTSQFISEVKTLSGFEDLKVGEKVYLASDVSEKKKGLRVRLRALFANGTALVQEDYFGSGFVKGPLQDAQSFIVRADQLQTQESTSLSNETAPTSNPRSSGVQ